MCAGELVTCTHVRERNCVRVSVSVSAFKSVHARWCCGTFIHTNARRAVRRNIACAAWSLRMQLGLCACSIVSTATSCSNSVGASLSISVRGEEAKELEAKEAKELAAKEAKERQALNGRRRKSKGVGVKP